ncbi:hypothetical protein LOTGIDRAFT_160482 [Lottia gigantea]|uniref:F-box domain-containing protein n=1 Tax=Lottia gigantea TaxID=225164 RepID=V4AP09_LOTGI|nr:hypothetical protein LOTGIDRAFT_160482 [Lottia gigantea]ESO95351.1 hypothetical protein LOTGIDRAFT_160482 [Lottia gigantea]
MENILYRKPLVMDCSVHEHCFNCFKKTCTITPDGFNSCRLIDCDHGCGFRFHECKLREHADVCQKAKVPCTNSLYGCRHVMPRSKIGAHLEYCPASVMCCPLEWNRWPLHSQEQNFKMALPTETFPVNCGQLDVALALRDQRMLIDSFKVPSKTRHSLRNSFTKKYPAAPINHRGCSVESDDYTSEDTSHGISDDDDAPWKLGRMPPGLQKSICNALYRAAKDASNPELLTVRLDMVPKSAGELEADKRKRVDIHISESESDRSRSASVEFQSDGAVNVIPEESEPENGSNSQDPRKIQLRDVLGVDLIVECISKFKSKPSSMYTFLCAQNFRRDEFASHTRNVHNVIQPGLNGMLEERCPLAYLGCTFTCRKLRPKLKNMHLIHSSLLESFGLKYAEEDQNLSNIETTPNDSRSRSRSRSYSGDVAETKIPTINTGLNWDSPVRVKFDEESVVGGNEDQNFPLLDLPVEIIEYILLCLDGFSICNLALTCQWLRDICCSLLDNRGIVTHVWEKRKKILEDGKQKIEWHIKCNRWCFTTAFTPVDSWEIMDHPSISDHLKVCQFNKDKIQWDKKFSIFHHDKDGKEMSPEDLDTRLKQALNELKSFDEAFISLNHHWL